MFTKLVRLLLFAFKLSISVGIRFHMFILVSILQQGCIVRDGVTDFMPNSPLLGFGTGTNPRRVTGGGRPESVQNWKHTAKGWKQLERIAQDRVRSRMLMGGLCSSTKSNRRKALGYYQCRKRLKVRGGQTKM